MFTHQSINDQAQSPFEARFKHCGGFWGRKFGRHGYGGHPWAHKLQQFMNSRKAANIEETDQAYVLSLYAAGLKKENFRISVNDDVLTIKYATDETGSEVQYILQEYQPGSFERSFQLNDKVLTENIEAVYVDGVLKVTLQKNPETTKPAQEVKVA
ncbi:heat-shock protein Hsp20 [Niabella ginsenosidivorans]|uniref:Heat-shock protein Hsp20 n=1 Tax=Niabella ginsenosidivorans TaxID=1176587 RepID=A0A1A9I2R5_9BACT|nr:Hsp20/alpha crystallin family protein [Niabella ginsenosidivorans]ANH81823.1 heat-shock protein Hsp20 [Niabella ginsenosidivorans]